MSEPSVFLLWELVDSWDGLVPELISVHATIEGAQHEHLLRAWPLAGPRGGKRPPRPAVTWIPQGNEWQPDDGTDYYIERQAIGE